MNPKDVALVSWALARIDYPKTGSMTKKIESYIYHLVKKMKDGDEGYLYEKEDAKLVEDEEEKNFEDDERYVT